MNKIHARGLLLATDHEIICKNKEYPLKYFFEGSFLACIDSCRSTTGLNLLNINMFLA